VYVAEVEVGSLTSVGHKCWSATDTIVVGKPAYGITELEDREGSSI